MNNSKRTNKKTFIIFILKKWYIIVATTVFGAAIGMAAATVLLKNAISAPVQLFTLYQTNVAMSRSDGFPFGAFLEYDAVKREIVSTVGPEASERIGRVEPQANNIVTIEVRDNYEQAKRTVEAAVGSINKQVAELYSRDAKYVIISSEEKIVTNGMSRKKIVVASTLFFAIIGVSVVLLMHDMRKRVE